MIRTTNIVAAIAAPPNTLDNGLGDRMLRIPHRTIPTNCQIYIATQPAASEARIIQSNPIFDGQDASRGHQRRAVRPDRQDGSLGKKFPDRESASPAQLADFIKFHMKRGLETMQEVQVTSFDWR